MISNLNSIFNFISPLPCNIKHSQVPGTETSRWGEGKVVIILPIITINLTIHFLVNQTAAICYLLEEKEKWKILYPLKEPFLLTSSKRSYGIKIYRYLLVGLPFRSYYVKILILSQLLFANRHVFAYETSS